MADNIKIIGNIVSTTQLSRYSQKDLQLIPQKEIQSKFGGTGDYIEYFVYDIAGNLLNADYGYLNYKLPANYNLAPNNTQAPNTTGNIQTENVGVVSTLSTNTSSLYPIIEIDPVSDLQSLGYSSGEFNVRYNLFQNKVSNVNDAALYIREISQDRTEVRLASLTLTNVEIENVANSLIEEMSNSQYYVDYLLNFGNDNQVVAVNVALNKAPEGYELLFKLYQPLSIDIQEKDSLWVVREKVEPYVFDINLDKLIITPPALKLRGPNFDIKVPDQGTVSTEYNTYSNLVTSLQLLQSSSYNQILNLINEKGIDINVDYTDFDNFVFFGSAYKRVSNFYYKVQQIEDYKNLINKYTPYIATTSSLQAEVNSYSSSINDIITQFDGYEYYLYFESSSYAWPKSTSTKPYTLLSTGSATVVSWYNALTGSAKDYDNNNYDNLEYVIPAFIREDENNTQFLTFLNMVGHYFDNIWIYLKAITDINKANNNLEVGISKDLVYNQLQSLGIKLYNSQAGEDVDKFLIGSNTGSAYYSGSLNDFSPTSSYLNNIPRKDLLSELYKRIYHNLPLLLKSKGTVAGLEYLISMFGIPSKTYITGSVTSGSILNVKEFGGSTKTELIAGYNNDKVRIVNNTITGSVLSSMLSLQTYPTASAQFRDDDLHYIDISFSPETQMDTYVSGAIASNNPSWNLDDYIGDPRQLYSSSYSDLSTQRTLYYQTGVSGYPGFTGSLLDYNGFIRLIQFFDNALFKMLGDFVPERTSLSTGVTINSPLLERNKAVYSVPSATTQSVYTAEYQTSSISAPYDHLYKALQGDKKPFFTGEFSGSVIDVHQYFEDDANPYDGDWNVWNLQHPVSQSINNNTFIHSDWNVLLNNVSQSVLSNVRQDIEYIYGTTGSIVRPAELQDSYLSLKSYVVSRYDGSKTVSLTYNTYTSASYTGSDGMTIQDGDKSYGKTAAIDHNVRKIGLFTQIETSSFLPSRNNVSIKYLVDDSGSLTELNQLNKHWCEIQNTFTAGNYSNISLFDNRKYGNQKFTDGNKLIFDSGYSYYPVLYFSGSCGTNNLYFQSNGIPSAYLIRARNNATSYYISGSATLGFPVSGGFGGAVNNIFNQEIEDSNGVYTVGNFDQPPTYSISDSGYHKIYATFDMDISSPSLNVTTWSLQVLSGSTIIAEDEHSNLSATVASASNNSGYTTVYQLYSNTIPSYVSTATKEIYAGGTSYPVGTQWYVYTGTKYITGSALECGVEDAKNPLYSPKSAASSNYGPGALICSIPYSIYQFSVAPMYDIPDFNTSSSGSITFTIDRGYTNPANAVSLTSGDKLAIRLALKSGSGSNYTASISQGSLIIGSLSQAIGYSVVDCPFFNSASIAAADNEIVFTSILSTFYDNNYTYVPNPLSGSINYLYSTYGDVDYPFVSDVYDIVVLYLSDNTYIEARIINIYIDGSNLVHLVLDTQLSENVKNELTAGTYKRFLLLTRREDETNAYIIYQKRDGQTSYGFIIPDRLAPDMLNNIDIITKQVKQKLLADQQGTTA